MASTVKKIRIGIIFGGRSGEHEVSLLSAQSVMAALDRDKYEVIPLGITREGHWLIGGDPMAELKARLAGAGTTAVRVGGQALQAELSASRALLPGLEEAGLPYVDVLFPVLHGPYGEDGTVQGLFELAGIPYVGSGVLGSALAMDKAAMKSIFRAEGLPCVDHLLLMRWEWEQDQQSVLRRVQHRIGYPCFVKPANLGSSVGVSKAHNRDELVQAIDLAARYDRRLLVEEAVDAREIECSVLGNDRPQASVLGEVVPKREFYDYEAKYLDDRTELIIPVALPASKVAEIQMLAVRAFVALDCAGLARADFLMSRDSGQVYVNELNTIPGFTAMSMYPKLWEASGLSYPKLLDQVIELALERAGEKARSSVWRS
ncbi:MAG: D-alanine--D-alanine ligase [Chloroflexi bacterium]|nr:D-alanine--D-alanine ligase [Chloroflexota bacterium]